MESIDWGQILRSILGFLAISSAAWQAVMRVSWAGYMGRRLQEREKAGAIATTVVLIGVAVGQVVNLEQPLTIAYWLILTGVLLSLYANYKILQAVREQGDLSSYRDS